MERHKDNKCLLCKKSIVGDNCDYKDNKFEFADRKIIEERIIVYSLRLKHLEYNLIHAKSKYNEKYLKKAIKETRNNISYMENFLYGEADMGNSNKQIVV